MKHFKYESAASYDEAAKLLAETEGNKAVMAGGTDLLGAMKDAILMDYPETVISLGEIEGTDYIKDEGDCFKIGAMTKLSELASSEALKAELKAIPEAAHSVASPLIRNRATVGGNLCQDVRCWFYRYPNIAGGRLECLRKGGEECFAIRGDNRYHSVFGGMKVGTTPCSMECPAGTNIPAYMAKLREGDREGAAKILMEYNPLPMMTSRVCAHTCQSKCNRTSTDESVAIHTVERTVADYILENIDKFYKAPAKETGKKIAIVGGGPAGLTAAFYLRNAGNDVTIYEAQEEAGGCLMYAIPNYRLPKSYVRTVVKAFEGMGIKILCNTKLGEGGITAAELEKDFDKVFYATGAWSRPVLGFDGEEFTEFGLQFLMDVNKWVNKKERNNVLVVGGGNVSMDVAVTAKRLGAKSVTLACLEQRWEMPASEEEIARAEEEGIVIMNGYGVKRALYEGEKLTGMEMMTCTAVRDETGRFNPQYDETQLTQISADSVLMAAGQKVDLSFIEAEYELAKNRGLFKVDDSQRTSRENVFAGGDAASGPSTVIKAIRSGRNAAEAINDELGIPNPAYTEQQGFLHFAEGCGEKRVAQKDNELSVGERALDKEDTTSVSPEEGKCEADRCMNCACYSVNASDLSPVMIALDATLVTNKKRIAAKDFFTTELKAYDMLDDDEIITEIDIPKKPGYVTAYEKFRMRDSIDFAMASMASAYKLAGGVIDDVSIILGAVAPIPVKATKVEALLKGKKPTEALAKEAAELAAEGAAGIGHNSYKVQEIKTFVERLVLSMM